MENFLEKIDLDAFFDWIFNTPATEWNGRWVLAYLGMIVIVCWIIVKLWKYVKSGALAIHHGWRKVFSAKLRCKKIQCPTCGRTLDACVCAKNKKLGYRARLRLYHKEQRAIKKTKKIAAQKAAAAKKVASK